MNPDPVVDSGPIIDSDPIIDSGPIIDSDPGASPVAAGRPAAAVSALPDPLPAAPAASLPAPGKALDGIRGEILNFLDRVDNWLSTLPPNPLTKVASGALWLVRRALGGTPPGWSVSGSKVEIVNKTNQTIDVTKKNCTGTACKVLLEPGQSTDYLGYKTDGDWDVALSIFTTKPSEGSGDLVPDERRLIVKANNPAVGRPNLALFGSPVTPGGPNRAYLAAYYDKGWLYNSWEPLREGQGCSCDANNSGGPADGGVKAWVVRNGDVENYKSFTVEIWGLPAAPATTESHERSYFYCNGHGAKTSSAPPPAKKM